MELNFNTMYLTEHCLVIQRETNMKLGIVEHEQVLSTSWNIEI